MKTKQILACLLSAMMLLGALFVPAFADAGDNDTPFIEPPATEATTAPADGPEDTPPALDGLTFDVLGRYPISNAFATSPRTLEAEILLPTSHTAEGGVILSNENIDSNDFFITVQVARDGVPCVLYKSRDRISYEFRFDSVDVRSEDGVHLALVLDPDGQMLCYIDGALAETVTCDRSEKPHVDYHADSAKNPFFLGGDASEKNEYFFKGALRSLAVYDDVRSAEEIKSDFENGADASDSALLCAYTLDADTKMYGAKDLSANGNDLISNKTWFYADEGGVYTGTYDFSLAVVGDTQLLSYYGAAGKASYRDSLGNLYQWIVDNAEAKKMKYAIGLGDITEKDTDKEWEFAKAAITKMDGVLPYSLIRGQGHDTVPQFNKYFADHAPFTSNLGGTYRDGSVASSWQEFSYGEIKYLIVSLDFGATDEILAWADGVVEAHPEHRVIVVTHAYLEKNGTTLDREEGYNAAGYPHQDTADSLQAKNDGVSIWNKFASKHENIFMVLSGHMSADTVVIKQRKGEAGNTVTEMLIDPQTMDGQYAGGTGMVAMLYFSVESGEVGVEYYSTNLDVYRPLQVFDVNHTHAYVDTVVPPTCADDGYTSHVCACGDALSDTDRVSKLAHTYDDDYDADCNVCGDVRKVEERPADTTETADGSALPEEPATDAPTLDTESAPESVPESDPTDEPVSEPESEPEVESTQEADDATEENTAPGDGEVNSVDNGGGVSVLMIVVITGGACVACGGVGFAVWFFLFRRKNG